jgi:hypothetical protein
MAGQSGVVTISSAFPQVTAIDIDLYVNPLHPSAVLDGPSGGQSRLLLPPLFSVARYQ